MESAWQTKHMRANNTATSLKAQIKLFLKRVFDRLARSAPREHLSFKGIPLNGNINNFCQKLKEKGFTQCGSEGNIRIFKGTFTGRAATIGVASTENGKDVFSIIVLFPETGNWIDLTNTYEHYKDLYTEKYGDPSECTKFNYRPLEDNITKIADVRPGAIVCGAIFTSPSGLIQLSIEKTSGIYKGQLMSKYQDYQYITIKRQKDIDEI